MIRPEAIAVLHRFREVIFAGSVGLAGLWLIWLGGVVLIGLGLGGLALAAVLALTAWRRMQFSQAVAAPGLVEVIEGQVGYLGPSHGGYASLTELAELRLVTMGGRRAWRLKQLDGQTVLIPVDASGAEGLFDAFSSLPGMDVAGLLAALAPGDTGAGKGLIAAGAAEMRLVWRRQGRGVMAGQP
jgi:hypothetical protein